MESRQQRTRRIVTKWVIYIVLLLLCAALQTMPGFLQFGDVKAIFILPLCVTVAIHEGEFAGGLFGVLGGLTWDYTAGRTVGIFAIAILFLCFFISVLEQLYLRCTIWNYFLLLCAANILILSEDFLFFYWMPLYHEPLQQYLTVVLPMALLSAVLTLPMFYLVRGIREKFSWQT